MLFSQSFNFQITLAGCLTSNQEALPTWNLSLKEFFLTVAGCWHTAALAWSEQQTFGSMQVEYL